MINSDATGVVRGLAAAAAARSNFAGAGRYHYVQTRGWYLSSSQLLLGDELQHLHSEMEEVDRELWLAEDGSGRIEEYVEGVRLPTSNVYPRGQLDFPGEPSAYGERIDAEYSRRGRSPFRLLADLWSSRVVTSDLQSRLLGLLSREARLTTASRCTDRLGRSGIALRSADALFGQASGLYVVILAESTGALLAAEDVALEPADWLPDEPPCTTSYTAFVSSGVVDDLGTRPTLPYWAD